MPTENHPCDVDREPRDGPAQTTTRHELAALADALLEAGDEDTGEIRVASNDNDTLPWGEERPRTRGDCAGRPRPCPWVSCRYHVLDITAAGTVYLNIAGTVDGQPSLLKSRPTADVKEQAWMDEAVEALLRLPATCALDIAEEDAVTLDHIGQLLGVSRKHIRQIEVEARDAMRDQLTKLV